MCRLFCIRYVFFVMLLFCVCFLFFILAFSVFVTLLLLQSHVQFHFTLWLWMFALSHRINHVLATTENCVLTFQHCNFAYTHSNGVAGLLAYMYCSMFNVHIKLNVFLLLLSLLLPLMVGCCFCHCRMCYPRSTQKNSTTAYKLNNTAYYAWYVYIYFANVRARFQIHFAHKWLSTKTRQTRQTSHFLSRFCSLFCRLSSDVWSFRFGVYLWLSVGRRRATSLFVILFYFQTTKQNKNDKNTAKKST